MGFLPEKEAAKSTLLLIAMLLGGCIPSHSFVGPGTRSSPAMQGIDDWIEYNPCGVLHFTERVVNITGRIVVRQTLSPGVTLFIAPNMTEEDARYVLNHCRFIMRQRLLWKGQFSLKELPVGQYFLAADTDNASGVVIKSLIIHRTTDTSVEIPWTRRLGEYEIMAFRITHNGNDTNEFSS
jgi:hypothetical protein